jgi:hypothetical protein
VQIPDPIINKYRDMRLFIDIFWVNGSPYVHTISQWIKFRTVAPINNKTKITLLMETQAVLNMYGARGFNITRVEADQEFVCITNNILPIQLNAAVTDDHVHEVEWSIRTVKERTRCTIQGLPLKKDPESHDEGRDPRSAQSPEPVPRTQRCVRVPESPHNHDGKAEPRL